MEIPIDRFGARKVGVPAETDPVAGLNPLDWDGLMARLAAAHAARRILADRPCPGDSPSGSFAPDVAREVAAWRAVTSHQSTASSPHVNLNAKADGKPAGTIGRNSAGENRSIVRGLI